MGELIGFLIVFIVQAWIVFGLLCLLGPLVPFVIGFIGCTLIFPVAIVVGLVRSLSDGNV